MRHFLLLLLLINLAQAAFTIITADEAYYRTWSFALDWGYFDHPSGTALSIACGRWLAGDATFGIRLFFVLSQTAALWLVFEKIAKVPVPFFPVYWGIPILHVYGWLATPDALLLLGAAIFFWRYQAFLKKDTPVNALFLGIAMSGMIWCKYHGVLVILFTIMSNWTLVRNPRAWMAVFISLLLFFPHLYWQWTHDFITVHYHFGERSPEPYVFRHSVEFIVNQLLLFNPVLLPVVIIFAIRYRSADAFSRAMKFNLLGFPIFFLTTTINNYAEPHWTYVIVIPMLYFLWKKQQEKPFPKWVKASVWIVTGILLAARCALLFPRDNWPIEMVKVKNEANAIREAAGNLPMVVGNSYQITAATSFYSRKKTYGIAIANGKTRENQYTAIWNDEWVLQGDTVFVVAPCRFYEAQKLTVKGFPNDELWGKRIAGFQFLKQVKITPSVNKTAMSQPFHLHIANPYPVGIHIDQQEWSVLVWIYKPGDFPRNMRVPIPDIVINPGSIIDIPVSGLEVPGELLEDSQVAVVFSLAGREEPFSLN